MTLGEAINARARAGARMVECREKVKRLGSAATINSQPVIELVHSEIDYAAALGIQRVLEQEKGFGIQER